MLLDSVLQNLDIVKLLETQTNKKVLIFAPPLSRKTIHLMMHFSECKDSRIQKKDTCAPPHFRPKHPLKIYLWGAISKKVLPHYLHSKV